MAPSRSGRPRALAGMPLFAKRLLPAPVFPPLPPRRPPFPPVSPFPPLPAVLALPICAPPQVAISPAWHCAVAEPEAPLATVEPPLRITTCAGPAGPGSPLEARARSTAMPSRYARTCGTPVLAILHGVTLREYRDIATSQTPRGRQPDLRTCSGCGRHFVPRRFDQSSCSHACRQRRYRESHASTSLAAPSEADGLRQPGDRIGIDPAVFRSPSSAYSRPGRAVARGRSGRAYGRHLWRLRGAAGREGTSLAWQSGPRFQRPRSLDQTVRAARELLRPSTESGTLGSITTLPWMWATGGVTQVVERTASASMFGALRQTGLRA